MAVTNGKMTLPDLSNAALETLTDSDMVQLANNIGMNVPSRGEPREQTLRRIQAWRDRSIRTREGSGRGHDQVCSKTPERFTESTEIIPWERPRVSRRTYLWITIQALLIAASFTAVLWYYSAE